MGGVRGGMEWGNREYGGRGRLMVGVNVKL